MEVFGPWARQNGSPNLAAPFPGTNAWHFYTAETGIFSPFGQWHLHYFEGHLDGNDCIPPGVNGFVDETIDFCLQQHPSVEIDITINPDFSANVNAVTPSCPDSLTATANLGHESGIADPDGRNARLLAKEGVSDGDRDTFIFEGDAGEALTITLAGDGSGGHIGGPAALQLLFEDVVIAEVDGPLPLELSTTLLEPGEYHIAVLEQREGDGAGFRGRYVLSVAPEAGSDDRLLEPRPDVEHF